MAAVETNWSILQDPPTAAIPVTVVTRAETGRSLDTSGAVGRGLTRPFRRDQKLDFANDGGVGIIAANVGQILGTLCAGGASTGGELPWRTEFGSLLHILRLRNNDESLVEEAKAYVVDAIQRWEPRARITSLRIDQDFANSRLIIRIGWRPQAQGSQPVVVAGLETEIALG